MKNNNLKTKICVSIARNYEKFWHYFAMPLMVCGLVLIAAVIMLAFSIPFGIDVWIVVISMSMLSGLMFFLFCNKCYQTDYKAEVYGLDFWTAWYTAIPGEDWDY